MTQQFQFTWDGDLPGTPEQVWDAITVHAGGWLWPVQYEPGVGGSAAGMGEEGTVTAWDPPRHFATESPDRGGVNALDVVLTPADGGATTHVAYRHRGVADDDAEVSGGREHTKFYYHSLAEYVAHFAGREAAYLAADAPPSSAKNGFTTLRRALGIADDVVAGDSVRLTPSGLPAIDGVVDYVAPEFLGVRTEDALYRFYGRDAWGWPVGVAHHLFAPAADGVAAGRAWQAWLDDLYPTDTTEES
ncbi:SRPBCC domain-containing protein [Jiangella alkaliphila]|uniref:Activator of Hsp90 ATPase homolog 1-like protein n=1 Tax=Jiangella alkaliphila TaxID=419479 RepID=A0A1H2KRJ5_9ACTN|nr:SRPBCC domain-containing protein [Jiangella alkaliphila]SDU71262.1 Activator of Hsp90 ATPase homolog 1-like protein [Jiangella alkaliphila]